MRPTLRSSGASLLRGAMLALVALSACGDSTDAGIHLAITTCGVSSTDTQLSIVLTAAGSASTQQISVPAGQSMPDLNAELPAHLAGKVGIEVSLIGSSPALSGNKEVTAIAGKVVEAQVALGPCAGADGGPDAGGIDGGRDGAPQVDGSSDLSQGDLGGHDLTTPDAPHVDGPTDAQPAPDQRPDGGADAGPAPIVVSQLAAMRTPVSLTVDADRIYFLLEDGQGTGQLQSLPIGAGTGTMPTVLNGALMAPLRGLAVDIASAYYSTADGLWSSSKSSVTAACSLATGGGVNTPTHLVLTDTSAMTPDIFFGAAEGNLRTVERSGAQPCGFDPSVTITPINGTGEVVDVTTGGGAIAYTQPGTGGTSAVLSVYNFGGGEVAVIHNLDGIRGVAVASNGNDIYYSSHTGSETGGISRLTVGTMTTSPLVTNQDVNFMILDAPWLYYFTDGGIYRFDVVAGVAPEPLAMAPVGQRVTAMALDPSFVYFSIAPGSGATGAILKLPR